MNVVREKIWPLAKRYWFDALPVIGMVVSVTLAVAHQDKENGPDGPLWFDVIAAAAFIVPLFFRRRHPFRAPVVTIVVIGATSFIDPALLDDDWVLFVVVIATAFLF